MKSYHKHKRRLRHRLLHEYKHYLRFFLFLAALVLVMIGNNFASFRSDDQPSQGNNIRPTYPPENSKFTGGLQEGTAPIYLNTPVHSEFGIGKDRQTESGIGSDWSGFWSDTGQWYKYYIQSAMNLQNGGLRAWEDYLLSSLGSSSENHQKGFGHYLGEGQLASLLNLSNQEGGGGTAAGHVFGALEYPHSTNYGGGYGQISDGGSSGLSGSGGGNSDIYEPQQNDEPPPTPEPSTLILTGIGLVLLARLVNQNRIQGIKDSSG